MDSEVKEKLEVKKRGDADPVSMYLPGIPARVHKKIQKYRTEIVGKRGRTFNLKEAYVEFLKEATKSIK